jgi:hypothetical protein
MGPGWETTWWRRDAYNELGGMLTLSATVLAIIAACSPTEERAHNLCQRDFG